jgi:hypothetical protein
MGRCEDMVAPERGRDCHYGRSWQKNKPENRSAVAMM